MDPLTALAEIAALLEQERASKYRAKAFRKAIAVLEAMPDAERDDLAAVRRAAGIGDTTFTVISQAREGRVPDYLAELRGTASLPVSALRSRLRGDLHCHSEWSDGATPVAAMVDAARTLGHEYLALTDHSPRLRVAHGLSAERLEEQLEHLATLDTGPLRLLSGIEVDVLDDGSLDQSDELLDRLDVVVASAHSTLRMPSREMTARLVAAASDPRTDVLGHVTGRLVSGERGTRPPSTFDAAAVFRACADHGTAVEINARPEREDPPDELIALAIEAGCLFAIDSDAHAPGQLGLLDYGAERAERLGVPEERIVTTWPLERLLEWTRA
ncbi:PHP domain-containing protein [Rathayibacter sp. VKM Ac-2754]|uniref:PHP domain-containing protein n=1 Tax=Rathayibacter sp. VKM Ac-2754 TaxID=2609251 RepID=UPI00135764D7|nr:PHP domain-containing protein [Rathayibacter sp. VKM Ac-2754]MWV60152.1 PHP domain-containing protein [Rathayibacter sp. VKM Ac-2754]